MTQPKIIVHCLIKNEERFIWYAIKSVLPFIDKVMVWDTGSTDNTVKIVKSIKSKKIKFKQHKSVDAEGYTKLRQQMLDQTSKIFTWLLILDGDEVWPQKSIKKVTQFARNNLRAESIVVRTNNLVGDIYHKLPESAGNYQLAGKKGHLAIRLINLKNIPGLYTDKPHGQHGYFDQKKRLIQNRPPQNIKFLNIYYNHATHLQRSSSRAKDNQVVKRASKYKYEIGKRIPKNQIPQIFFTTRPNIVPDISGPASALFWLKASLLTPARHLKRLFSSSKHGY